MGVTEMGVCPICNRPLDLNAPDTVAFDGEMAHSECVVADALKKAEAQENKSDA